MIDDRCYTEKEGPGTGQSCGWKRESEEYCQGDSPPDIRGGRVYGDHDG